MRCIVDAAKIKCWLLDMDGTVYLGGRPIDGAVEAIGRMRSRAKVLFLTNNTSVARSDYADKLNFMHICATEDDIYTAGNATIDWLKKHGITDKIFLLGTDKLKAEFIRAGLGLTDAAPDMVVVGFDTSLRYERLSLCCKHIREGVRFIATHPDFNCPVGDGYIPDVGSFLALIKASTGRDPELVCGKPNPPIAEGVAARAGCRPDEIAMVGDRLMTDMRFAVNNGFKAVLVLSGEATEKDAAASGIPIDAVVPSIKYILG